MNFGKWVFVPYICRIIEQEHLNLEQPEKDNMIWWETNLSIKNKPFLQLHVANIDVSLGIAGFVLRIGTRAF